MQVRPPARVTRVKTREPPSFSLCSPGRLLLLASPRPGRAQFNGPSPYRFPRPSRRPWRRGYLASSRLTLVAPSLLFPLVEVLQLKPPMFSDRPARAFRPGLFVPQLPPVRARRRLSAIHTPRAPPMSISRVPLPPSIRAASHRQRAPRTSQAWLGPKSAETPHRGGGVIVIANSLVHRGGGGISFVSSSCVAGRRLSLPNMSPVWPGGRRLFVGRRFRGSGGGGLLNVWAGRPRDVPSSWETN
jgi:hypothetical protein